MIFQEQKKKQLSLKDKSSIGSWDKKISKLCKKINKNKNYYTTSSCAGRIILIKASEEKQPGLFIFRTHNKSKFEEIKKELEKAKKIADSVYFKQEPCILHVACKDLDSAQYLVDKAKFCGWKRSGIMATKKRIMCELMSTEHTEVPIIFQGKILANDELLKVLIKESNRKLERVWEKIKKFEKFV